MPKPYWPHSVTYRSQDVFTTMFSDAGMQNPFLVMKVRCRRGPEGQRIEVGYAYYAGFTRVTLVRAREMMEHKGREAELRPPESIPELPYIRRFDHPHWEEYEPAHFQFSLPIDDHKLWNEWLDEYAL